MTLHDYFTQPRYVQDPSSETSPSNAPESDARDIQQKPDLDDGLADTLAQDQWALQYIGVHHVGRLIEVIDDDMSSFVNVDEVNLFTSARPADWR